MDLIDQYNSMIYIGIQSRRNAMQVFRIVYELSQPTLVGARRSRTLANLYIQMSNVIHNSSSTKEMIIYVKRINNKIKELGADISFNTNPSTVTRFTINLHYDNQHESYTWDLSPEPFEVSIIEEESYVEV